MTILSRLNKSNQSSLTNKSFSTFFDIISVTICFVFVFVLQIYEYPNLIKQMDFDECFLEQKIYPDIMRHWYFLCISRAIYFSPCIIVYKSFVLNKFSKIHMSVRLTGVVITSLLFTYGLSLFFVFIGIPEINFVIIGLIFVVIILCLGLNSFFIIALFFDTDYRNAILVWPNWFCLFSLEFIIIDLWFASLQFFYIPL
jgi:hypothetical protein